MLFMHFSIFSHVCQYVMYIFTHLWNAVYRIKKLRKHLDMDMRRLVDGDFFFFFQDKHKLKMGSPIERLCRKGLSFFAMLESF